MKHLTIRNVPRELEQALRAEQRRDGRSLNRTVLDLLSRTLGVTPGRTYQNGLAQLAGAWSADDLARFEADTAIFEKIDKELWS